MSRFYGRVKKGYLTYGKRKYHTLLLLEVETMMPATADALASFTQQGGKLIIVVKESCKSAGWKDFEVRDKKVQETLAIMKKKDPAQIFTVSAPGNIPEEVMIWFREVQRQCGITPYVRIDQSNLYISQIRHWIGEKELYFFTNCNPDDRVLIRVTFPENKFRPWIWDPETRSFGRYLHYEKELNSITRFNYLDLGKVYGVSEVTVNDEALGCKWYGRHRYRIPEHLARAGLKDIQIKITTTMGNYLKSSPDNKVEQAWTHHQPWQPMEMPGPVRLI